MSGRDLTDFALAEALAAGARALEHEADRCRVQACRDERAGAHQVAATVWRPAEKAAREQAARLREEVKRVGAMA